MAEHLTFNQGVRSSSLRWVTIPSPFGKARPGGRGGMADAPDLGSGAKRRMGSSPFARTTWTCGSSSVVECHLAKVDVASSNLVYRSTFPTTDEEQTTLGGCSSMVEPQPSKLVTWVRFPSPAPPKSTIVRSRGASEMVLFLRPKRVAAFVKANAALVPRRWRDTAWDERRKPACHCSKYGTPVFGVLDARRDGGSSLKPNRL